MPAVEIVDAQIGAAAGRFARPCSYIAALQLPLRRATGIVRTAARVRMRCLLGMAGCAGDPLHDRGTSREAAADRMARIMPYRLSLLPPLTPDLRGRLVLLAAATACSLVVAILLSCQPSPATVWFAGNCSGAGVMACSRRKVLPRRLQALAVLVAALPTTSTTSPATLSLASPASISPRSLFGGLLIEPLPERPEKRGAMLRLLVFRRVVPLLGALAGAFCCRSPASPKPCRCGR